MPLVVDDREAEEFSRLVGIRLCLLTLRHMENWREWADDGDKALILVAVAAINGERFTRDDSFDKGLWNVRNLFPQQLDRNCNISSVAAATGFNREKTRRKVNELVEASILMSSARGRLRFNPESRQVDFIVDLLRRQLDVFVRVANDLVRDGVVTHTS